MQIRLLRALQEKEIERVGDQTPVPVDVRIIAATHRDLKQLCREGRFREDLFYRLNVIPIHLPPLRERRDDIPLLVDHFLRTIGIRTGKKILGITEPAMEILVASPWPGNIRELINVLEYAFVVCREEYIGPQHLPAQKAEAKQMPQGWKKNVFERTQKDELIKILQEKGGNRQETSRALGISRVTLWKLLKKHGISVEARVRTDDPALPGP